MGIIACYNICVTNLNFFSLGLSMIFETILIKTPMSLSLIYVLFLFFLFDKVSCIWSQSKYNWYVDTAQSSNRLP